MERNPLKSIPPKTISVNLSRGFFCRHHVKQGVPSGGGRTPQPPLDDAKRDDTCSVAPSAGRGAKRAMNKMRQCGPEKMAKSDRVKFETAFLGPD